MICNVDADCFVVQQGWTPRNDITSEMLNRGFLLSQIVVLSLRVMQSMTKQSLSQY